MSYRITNKPTKNELYQLYIVEKMTSRDIAKKFNCGYRTVLRCLDKYGISKRNAGGERRIDLENYEWIKSEYERLMSVDKLADICNTSSSTIRRVLNQFNIPINPQGTLKGFVFSEEARKNIGTHGNHRRGEAHPQWKGDLCKKAPDRSRYPSKTWSKQVRIRDNYTCQDCGDKDGVKHAHHIKPWKQHPKLRYDVDNGVTLCIKCHQKRHKFPFPKWIYNQGKTPTSAEHSKE